MQLKHYYWYFTKAIKKETIEKIITTCQKLKLEKGATFDKDKEWRNSGVSFIEDKWIYDILNPFIHGANRNSGWNFEWDWNEPSQFTKYGKNQFYKWHVDMNTTPYDENYPNKNLRNKIRKLSLTLQLTDPSGYEGGDFQFKWLDYVKNVNSAKIVTVKEARALGSVIIFPSYIWHRITPITKGTRLSLVNWSVGKPFK